MCDVRNRCIDDTTFYFATRLILDPSKVACIFFSVVSTHLASAQHSSSANQTHLTGTEGKIH